MGVSTSLTFEDFEKYQDDGLKHELLEGEHITLPPPKRPHTRVQQNLQDALRPYVREHHLGEVHIEAGFKLSSQTWLQPDVSFVRSAQIRQGDPNEYYEGAPALAIEVASDSNTAAQLDMKMELYFAHGAEEGDDGATVRAADLLGQDVVVNRIVCEGNHSAVPLISCRKATTRC